jgi:hypothetical protein
MQWTGREKSRLIGKPASQDYLYFFITYSSLSVTYRLCLHSICLQLRAALARRRREASLDVDLLHAIVLLVEVVVHFGHVLDANTVCDHLEGINLALLNLIEQFVPVLVDGSLAVTDEADTAFHQGAWRGLVESCATKIV